MSQPPSGFPGEFDRLDRIGRTAGLPAPAGTPRAYVHVRGEHESTDTDIAREALHRLRNNVAVPPSVQALVRNSRITLEGTVRWMHQRSAAEAAVKYVAGVTGVNNAIVIVTAE